MTQEDKYLLLRDICARLPYGVKVHAKYTDLGEIIELDGIVKTIDFDGLVGIEIMYDTGSAWIYVEIDNVKPYLLPLSSMNEKQLKGIEDAHHTDVKFIIDIMDQKVEYGTDIIVTHESVDWCNKNHFDYRGLIDKGLAIDATNLNIY